MKVHNKGQVVIPGAVRRMMGIRIGGLVDIEFDLGSQKLKIQNPNTRAAKDQVLALAGRFARRQGKKLIPFPSRKEMESAMARGLAEESGF